MTPAIIIPNYTVNNSSLRMLERCLASIQRVEPYFLRATYIVDDGSPWHGTEMALRQLAKKYRCRLLLLDKNGGYSTAVNAGRRVAVEAEATVVVTVNTDVELTSPLIVPLLNAFEDEKVGVVGARLLYPSGMIQAAGFEVACDGSPVEYDKGQPGEMSPGLSKTRRFVFGVTGALQAFRISVGTYSEAYTLGYEDVEFCARAWMNGWKVLYEPAIEALHLESATRGKIPRRAELESLAQWLGVDFPKLDLSLISEKIAAANRS